METRLKVVTIVGTRPEIIRLSRIMPLLDRHTNHVIVHTGQNYDYELNQIFFEGMELRSPDHYLGAAGESAAATIANVIVRTDELLAKIVPDAVLVLGDTNSCLAVVAAKKRKIPIFHMEAGNRCFDQRVPEEANRKLVDHLSDVNLPYTQHAREHLLREGMHPQFVVKTGSPMREVLSHYAGRIENSDVLSRLGVSDGQYFVASAHREENIDLDRQIQRLAAVLNVVAERYGKPIILSTHPRTAKRLSSEQIILHPLVRTNKPFGFLDYVKLQQHSIAVLSDSGTITEESSILNFPAVNLRESHERPEGMEEGTVIFTGLCPNRVLQALDICSRQPRGAERLLQIVGDYEPVNVSEKVLRIIQSYTDYVKRVVYSKPLG